MLIMLKRVEHSLASSRMPSNTSTSLRDSTQPPTRSFSHTSTSDAVAVLGFRAIRLKLLVAPLHSLPPRPSRLHDSHSLQAGSSNTASSTARFMATAARADRPCIAGRVPPKPTRQQLRTGYAACNTADLLQTTFPRLCFDLLGDLDLSASMAFKEAPLTPRTGDFDLWPD